jgi:lipid-binding SYLF domain-containing protein
MKKLIVLLLSAFVAVPVFAQSEAAQRLQASAEVMREIMQTPDKGIPQDLLSKAACVIVIPSMKKGGFIVAAKYGRGYFSCRKQSGVGWSAPGGVRMEGGSFGFLIGGASTDVVMLVMNRRGAEKLMSSQFTLGGDASVAAGPVGRSSSAMTDAMMHAQILSYSRQRGVFAGLSLTGSTLRQDNEANKALYGSEMSNKTIIMGNVKPPAAAASFLDVLNKYSSRK